MAAQDEQLFNRAAGFSPREHATAIMPESESTLRPTKKVFILGAGFSKPSGMPLATELTDAILEHGYLLDNNDFDAWIADIGRRILRLEARAECIDNQRVNIEQLFDYARFDREVYLMRQQLCPVGRHSGDTPQRRADSIEAWLEYMEQGLVAVLLDQQSRASVDSMLPFIRSIRGGDVVLTFNYDTLLERAIGEVQRTWSHGFASESISDITVLKLHGSVDWWMFPRTREPPNHAWTLLFEKTDANRDGHCSVSAESDWEWEYKMRLFRATSLNIAEEANDAYTGLCRGEPPRPGLAGLGAHKPLHRLVGSGVVWDKALRAMRNADELFVIGWSASPYDSMARFFFSSALGTRARPPERVTVIGPQAAVDIGNYRAVFGNVIPVTERFECINDWETILSGGG